MIFDSVKIAFYIATAERRQWWCAEKVACYQSKKLLDMLHYALGSVEYYRSLGVEPSSIGSASDLQQFPILTKEIMQKCDATLLADGYILDTCKTSKTSGSTGEPTTTAFDRDSWLLLKFALKIRRLLAYGIGPGKRVLLVSELHPDEIASIAPIFGAGLLFGQKYVSIHEPVEAILPVIEEFRPHALYAFPSYFAELLEFCERENKPAPNAELVFTSSEVLSASLRKRIESAMNARVCDVYGNTEFKEVAWQCLHGRYHINFESTWVETVDISDDGMGTVLLTSLVNRAMPLIRYRVGDRARLGRGACSCGRNGPWLAAVSGREIDMLILPDGRKLSPYLLTTIIESEPRIRRYQMIQNNPTSLEIRYISVGDHKIDESGLARALSELLGPNVVPAFSCVTTLPRTLRGKQKVFMRDFNSQMIPSNRRPLP